MGIKNYLSGIGSAFTGLGGALFGFGTNRMEEYIANAGFVPVGNTNNFLELENLREIESAYYQCSTLQTVIVNKAQCATNAEIRIVNEAGKEKPLSREILKRMARPNAFQTFDMFRAESKIYVQLYGWHLVWYVPNGVGGFVNIWNLNPVNTEIRFKSKYLFQTDIREVIDSIYYRYAGTEVKVPIDEIYVVRDMVATKSVTAIAQPPLLPTSRIIGLKMVVSNNIAAYDARNSMITTRGAQGFISPDQKDGASSFPLLANDIDDLKAQFYKGYGINRNQSKFVFSTKGIKYQPINMKTSELMLFEETEETMLRIVDVYGYRKELLAITKGATFENQDKAWKGLYQDTIIPEDSNELPALFAGWDLEKYGLHVESDYSHVAALMPDPLTEEQVSTERINNITAINAMPVPVEQKVKIAVDVLGVSTETALTYFSNATTTTETTPANT